MIIQVQDDLKKLKRSLGRITLHEKGETFNIKALDTAIHRTEHGIRVSSWWAFLLDHFTELGPFTFI